MARCYWCGKTVDDDDATMVTVLTGVSRRRAYTSRRLFHTWCVAEAKSKARHTSAIIFALTLVVAVVTILAALLIDSRAGIIGGVIIFLGVFMAITQFAEYS